MYTGVDAGARGGGGGLDLAEGAASIAVASAHALQDWGMKAKETAKEWMVSFQVSAIKTTHTSLSIKKWYVGLQSVLFEALGAKQDLLLILLSLLPFCLSYFSKTSRLLDEYTSVYLYGRLNPIFRISIQICLRADLPLCIWLAYTQQPRAPAVSSSVSPSLLQRSPGVPAVFEPREGKGKKRRLRAWWLSSRSSA